MRGRVSGMEYIPAKHILTRGTTPPWFGAEYNMNLYRGCCHGCIYCDSRSECYGIQDFDRVRAKENALELLRDDLRRKGKAGVVATGSMSDPYNPFEEELLLTRHGLELLAAYGFGAAVDTKSHRIVRDIDILREIKEQAPVLCKITITTWDDGLCAKLEPHVSLSSQRFGAIEELSRAGLYAGVLLTPVLPFLEDSRENILGIVKRAADSGAKFVYADFGVTLRQNQRDYYYTKLEELFPGEGLAERYRRRCGGRYYCAVPKAKELREEFEAACREQGLLTRMEEIVRGYRTGYDRQLSLFELE